MVSNFALLFAYLPLTYAVSAHFGGSILSVIVWIVWLDVYISSFNSIFTSALAGFERMEYEAAVYALQDFLIFSSSLTALYMGGGIKDVILLFVVCKGLAYILLSYILFSKFPKPDVKLDMHHAIDIYRNSLPFMGNAIFLLIIFRIDILMLGIIKDESQVGIYESGYTVIKNTDPLIMTFVAALYPSFSRMHKDRRGIFKYYNKSLLVLSAASLMLNAAIFVAAPQITSLVYGKGFRDSAAVVRILVIGGFLYSLTGLNTSFLNAARREKVNFYFVVAGSILNVWLNITLIPGIGYFGAAISTVATYLFLLVLQLSYIWLQQSKGELT
jgi:O-antigen/teichoic acid export membrane protein